MHSPRVLLPLGVLAVASMHGIARATATACRTVAADVPASAQRRLQSSGSGSSENDRAAVAEVLPSCNNTDAASIYLHSDDLARCTGITGFSFSTVNESISSENATLICASPSCREIVSTATQLTLNATSDCLVNDHIRLQLDILNTLSPACNVSYWFNASDASSDSASGSGLYDMAGYVGSSSWSNDPAAYVPADTIATASATTIATIVSITIGSLLAFVVVVIAVVWYKRQSLRDLRRHAYTDPLVDNKPQLGGGIFNANFANRMRFGRSSDGSRTTHTATSDGSANVDVAHAVALRPIQQTFHGDTLWSDQELLARHMRAEDIEDIRVIGNGGHGVVYLVRHRGRRLLASKRLVQDHVTREKTRLLIAEIKLVAKLEHPCIVQFVGAAWTTESDLQALFEYMPNGDLCTHLAKTSVPDESEPWDLTKVQIAMDIAEALVYVHSFAPPLVHRDLKSRNVLLDENMRAKLTDFGVSRFYSTNNTMTTGIGTSRWLAPEVIAGGGTYDQSCDIYSLGIVLSELDTHRLPFAGLRMPSGNPLPEMSILQLVTQGKLQPTFRASCPESLRAIALRCVAFDPNERPSAIEVSYVLRTIAKREFGM